MGKGVLRAVTGAGSLLAVMAVAASLPAGAGAQAGATIGGVAYQRVDPGPAFTERPEPAQEWAAPQPNRAEKAAGLLAYRPNDPGDCGPARKPRVEEHITSLSCTVAPMQTTATWLALSALGPVKGLEVTVSRGRVPVTVEVLHEHFWPQRTGWGSRQWYMTPELLLPCGLGRRTVPATRGTLSSETFDLVAGGSAGIWLKVTAPQGARAGVYNLRITVNSEGRRSLRLPLRVEVLPFELRTPKDRGWLLYADSGRWSGMTDAQVLAELRDWVSHGITGLVELPLGSLDLSALKSGGAPVVDARPFKRLASLCRQAGMFGPHVVTPGAWPEKVRDALGITANLSSGQWPEEVTRGVEAVAKAAVAATRDEPATWYYYGVDEPTGDNTYAIQDYQCWKRAGARTYATFYQIEFLQKASEYLLAPCFCVPLVASEEPARRALEACDKSGTEFWWYGTGSYVNPFPQERYLFHNRYGSGLLFWKSGARASVAWTFCRPHDDVFNDFDGSDSNPAEPKEQATAYPHLLKPDDWSTYQGAIPTIAYEGLREGWDDYRYLYTLSEVIREATASGEPSRVQKAAAARARMEALVAAVAWVNPMGPGPVATRQLAEIRAEVAGLVKGLIRR